jgi:hypothetical protein
VVWLQYLLLGLALPAIVKAAIVFAAALQLSWASAIAAQRMLDHARKFGAALRPS